MRVMLPSGSIRTQRMDNPARIAALIARVRSAVVKLAGRRIDYLAAKHEQLSATSAP
jgi:hypothetical protein